MFSSPTESRRTEKRRGSKAHHPTTRASPKASGERRWLGVRDDFRNWLVHAAVRMEIPESDYRNKSVADAPENTGTSGIAPVQAAAAAEVTRSITSGVNWVR